jgi:rhodanese-related sulfurtransferase
MGKTFQDFVAEARQRIQEVSPAEAEADRKKNPGATFLDVREPDETIRGRVPGAVLVPRGTLEMRGPQALPDPSARVYVYCAGGFRSALACDRLQEMGYTNVRNVVGGFKGWEQQGLPVER